MAKDTVVHVARYGKYLGGIARVHGVTPGAIWGRPDNADLVERWGATHIFAPGDVLLAKPKWTSVPVCSTTAPVANVPTVMCA